jgi:hypothetical protein
MDAFYEQQAAAIKRLEAKARNKPLVTSQVANADLSSYFDSLEEKAKDVHQHIIANQVRAQACQAHSLATVAALPFMSGPSQIWRSLIPCSALVTSCVESGCECATLCSIMPTCSFLHSVWQPTMSAMERYMLDAVIHLHDHA